MRNLVTSVIAAFGRNLMIIRKMLKHFQHYNTFFENIGF